MNDDRTRSQPSGDQKPFLKRTSTLSPLNTNEKKEDSKGFYIFQPNEIIARRYRSVKLLNYGTFCSVIECYDLKSLNYVALKIIRKVDRYIESSKLEVKVLKNLKKLHGDEHGLLTLLDSFEWFEHLVMVFPKYGPSFADICFELNSHNILAISRNIMKALSFLHKKGILHTDLKPDNILLKERSFILRNGALYPKNMETMLIDFGNAVDASIRRSTIITTRQYRAPEVILQDQRGYNEKVDVFSLGCIIFELYTSKILFCSHSNHLQLRMFEKLMGPIPQTLFDNIPESLKTRYFCLSDQKVIWPPQIGLRSPTRPNRPRDPSCSRERYSTKEKVDEIVMKLDKQSNLSEIVDENMRDLLSHMITWSPNDRWSIDQCLSHPVFGP
eukprot:TRINITY_DN618_c0_g1_i1.p1 TRINITY_DN618_c0_g1~~TRINITY_DN618_c0_g1_i1.p1  ORF type:complete len:386 (+),score=101.14 TRINITY_DN618_c0_g1_i1:67-1224(+)